VGLIIQRKWNSYCFIAKECHIVGGTNYSAKMKLILLILTCLQLFTTWASTMTKPYRPSLLPPRGQLERSYRPWMTWFAVCASIMTLICVVFGLTAYNIYFHRFGHTEHQYHAGDEISLLRAGQDLSLVHLLLRVWSCSQWTVSTFFYFVDVYKLYV
jgi:hypothetical protein